MGCERRALTRSILNSISHYCDVPHSVSSKDVRVPISVLEYRHGRHFVHRRCLSLLVVLHVSLALKKFTEILGVVNKNVALDVTRDQSYFVSKQTSNASLMCREGFHLVLGQVPPHELSVI